MKVLRQAKSRRTWPICLLEHLSLGIAHMVCVCISVDGGADLLYTKRRGDAAFCRLSRSASENEL